MIGRGRAPDPGAGEAALDDDQVMRALRTFVRAEFQAPVAAIAGFIELLVDDVVRAGLADYADDLGRMRVAAVRLNEVVIDLLEGPESALGRLPLSGAGSLRHDLRTPITTILGYGELLAEEARERDHHMLLEPLADVFDAARRLLGEIDRIADYAGAPAGPDAAPGILTVLDRAVEVVTTLSAEGPSAAPDLVGRVLVVDDSPSILDLVSRRLERDGHTVLTAGGGEEALRIARGGTLDLILLDLMMPGMTGLEVLRHLREEAVTARLPVIVISALDEVGAAVRCIGAGADDYLAKPLDPTLLRARIASSLERKFLRDREQEALRRLRSEQDRSDRLLRNILPDVIVERLQRGETSIADQYDEVTILFCDLVGFTALTSRLSPAETLALLNDVFSAFDGLVAEHRLEKVKTIGDAYMAVGGLPEPSHGHTEAVARMALAMRKVVSEVSLRRGLALDVRIGIETGPAVAGIIGDRKIFYDVWGDSVNTASRLEASALPGAIQVSANVRRILGSAFSFESRGFLDIRGKGEMEVYCLVA